MDGKVNNMVDTCKALGTTHTNVKELLENFYGKNNTLETMRESDTPDDCADIYVWKEADNYATQFIEDNDYCISDAEIEADCIGYACSQKGINYAVFCYAYEKQNPPKINGEFFQHLKHYPVSQNRKILIIYLQVEKTINEKGEKIYNVGNIDNINREPNFWSLECIKGNNILVYFLGIDYFNIIFRFMAAYNTQNLDLLRAICTKGVKLENFEGGLYLNDGFYSNLSYLYSNYGKMQKSYISFDGIFYFNVPYIDNYCFMEFIIKRYINRIDHIKEYPLKDSVALLITDDIPENISLNRYPSLTAVDFLPPSNICRFSARLTFENGEIRRYDFLPLINDDNKVITEKKENNEIVQIDGICFTDKIFRHGKIVKHIDMPDWMGYRNFPQRGQGISFVNGYSISTAELYFNSYPIEKFSYATMEDDVSILQYDYDEDGYGVGNIYNLNPANPLYLLNKNTLIAKELPEKFQQTNISIYPPCGGYSEGRVMVSLLGEIELQYHHNMMGCAGMWGYLDTDFNEVIPPQYIYAMNFINGQAIVCKGEWDIKEIDGSKKYWCDNEQWGVIDIDGKEIVPYIFDELYNVDGSDELFFVHCDGWKNGYFAIFNSTLQKIILKLDFDFDIGYMFNECFVDENNFLIFMKHLPGKETDYIYVYDLNKEKYIVYNQKNTERTLHGEKKIVINSDGEDIVVF